MEELIFLKRRAEDFLVLAKELVARDMLDIASFNVHQACQLRIKASLLRLTGSIPRMHGVRELLGILANILEEEGFTNLAEDIRNFVRGYRDSLIDIDSSYIDSRCEPILPSRSIIMRMIEVAEELFKLLESVEKYVLG